MTLIVISFVCLFIIVVVCAQMAMRYLEGRRKKRIAGMLQVVPEASVVIASLLREQAKPGEGSVLARIFRRFNFVRGAGDMIQQAALSWTATRLFRTMGVLGLGGMLAGILFPFLLNALVTSTAFGLAGAALPYLYVRSRRNKRMAILEKQLPDAMDFLARSMRAGHAFNVSIGMVGEDLPDPLGHEFRGLYNEQNLGASLVTAFANLTRRVPLLDMRFFASAVILQRQTGGNLSEVLERLSEVVRERFRLRGHVKAVSAHGRMTAGILTALPILTAVALFFVAPGYLQAMFKDPDGEKLIGAAVLSQVIGNLIIKKIIRIRV